MSFEIVNGKIVNAMSKADAEGRIVNMNARIQKLNTKIANAETNGNTERKTQFEGMKTKTVAMKNNLQSKIDLL
jgi:uncharacterized protein YdcH (DUF465 family)